MSGPHDDSLPARLEAPVLTPESVRHRAFSRAPFGRRGFDEAEVADFVHQVADELSRRDRREESERANAERHKRALRDWSRDDASARSKGTGNHPAETGPPLDVINLMARTQQDCDQAIHQTQLYCQRLAADAENHARWIIDEARREATAAGERAARAYRADSGPSYSPEAEDLRRRLAWMGSFIDSLGAAENQLSATREALQLEIDNLMGTDDTRTPRS